MPVRWQTHLEALRPEVDRVSGPTRFDTAVAIADERARKDLLDGIADRMGMPAVDPVRDGVGALADRLPGA